MIKINKGKEPREWSAKKSTPGFKGFEPIKELRDALLLEQGCICAYCMRRIPVKDELSGPTSKIEHVKSQEEWPKLQLKYGNMAICCPGRTNSTAHCDTSKLGRSLSFSLQNQALQNSIRYSSADGEIRSTNEKWNDEMKRFLNLNHPTLKLNRLNTLEGVIAALNQKRFSTSSIAAELKKWDSMGTNGRRHPYCGIIIWYLQKAIRSLSA